MNRISNEPAGYKIITLDTTHLSNYSNGTISEVLAENTNLLVKSYGMGGVATPSLRGTGAGHTPITWNNINLNNPMLGQTDLSLLPSGLIDDIQIYFGGASMIVASGGIGGIINLETKPDWSGGTTISLSPGIGSFGQFSGLAKVKSGGANFQSVTKAFLQSAENDFRYLNSEIGAEPVWQTRENSQVKQQGFMQELYYKHHNNILSARIWYQSAMRNLSPSMLIEDQNADEKQSDKSLRTMLGYDINRRGNRYFITGVWMSNQLDYSNQLASIDSRNHSETAVFKTGAEIRPDKNTMVTFDLSDEVTIVKSNNYSQGETRNTVSLTASADRMIGERAHAVILLREIFDKRELLVPDFSSGLQYRILLNKEYYLKANISRNSKIPSMNDLFWSPGGNPQLKNEYAWIYEFSYEMQQKFASSVTFNYDISLFRNNIKDMILWHPGEHSYWTADNIKSVNTSGLETSLSLSYSENALKSDISLGYSLTRATTCSSDRTDDNSIGKQLIYIPVNKANAVISLTYKNLYGSWISNVTGKRYTTADNSRFLPAYFVNNAITGIKLKKEGNSMDICFLVDNLFNVTYHTVAYYPLPGRSYQLKILLQIIKP